MPNDEAAFHDMRSCKARGQDPTRARGPGHNAAAALTICRKSSEMATRKSASRVILTWSPSSCQ